MTTLVSIDYEASIKKIADQVMVGIEAWRAAGELLVRLYDAHPGNRDKVKQDLSALPQGVLTTLERIGRRQLVPQVYAGAGHGFRELSKMPYDVQEKFLHEPVELLVVTAEGKADVLKVAVKDLSRNQARQVFGRQEPRDLPAQRAYLADINRQAKPLKLEDAFKLLKDKLVVLKPCEISRQQLAALLAQMG